VGKKSGFEIFPRETVFCIALHSTGHNERTTLQRQDLIAGLDQDSCQSNVFE